MEKVVCRNPKASRDFFLEDRFEAGLVLRGSEVKSLREGRASLKESYAMVKDSGVFLINSNISPYEAANVLNHSPTRERKLLLNRREIKKLIGKTREKGYTLIPVKIYFKNGYAKIELAIGKGKKFYDKRDDIRKRDAEREMSQAMKKKAAGR